MEDQAAKIVVKMQETLAELIQEGQAVLATHKANPPNLIGFTTLDNGLFKGWKARSMNFLARALGSESIYTQAFTKEVQHGYCSSAQAGIEILRNVSRDLDKGLLEPNQSGKRDVLGSLELICERFHLVARQLRSRHDSRPTLNVTDEYDVQDLLHALLLQFFEDVRSEEWTPTYAGKATRMDFLLKREEVVVETKHSRRSLSAGAVGTELIEDIARYKAHPNCSALVCFVYDPEGLLPNPRGLESDLRRDDDFPVVIYIRP